MRSDVQAATVALEAARRELSSQRAASVPRLSVGARLERDGGQMGYGPELGVDLPLFARNQAGRAEAKANVTGASARLQRETASAEVEAELARSRFEQAQTLETLAGPELVDEARKALDSVQAGYLAGEIDLPSAVLLQTQIINGERAVIELSGRIAWARIDLLLALEQPSLLGGAP